MNVWRGSLTPNQALRHNVIFERSSKVLLQQSQRSAVASLWCLPSFGTQCS
jgi:hypothetical protein